MPKKSKICGDPVELRRHAEAILRDRRRGHLSKEAGRKSEADTARLLHELEVHQIELELQNSELRKARDGLEVRLGKYTDLYEFMPMGYFSVDESGEIMEANLTGAALLGEGLSRFNHQRFLRFVAPVIHVRFADFTSGAIEKLNANERTAFYRVAQEALTNVVRHARASHVEVNFEKLPGAISLKIKDNGKSFQPQPALRSKQNQRLGLLGMRERLEMVGGSFSVESKPGNGTTIQAQIPLGNGRSRGSLLG